MTEKNLYIGLMSGTSMDAIDTALVQFEGENPEIIAYRQFPIDTAIRSAIRKLDGTSSLETICKYDGVMAKLFAEAVLKILDLAEIPASWVKAVGSHGQTVFHNPDAPYPSSIQIGDPNIISEQTNITTITDFRRMDIASGGQGAPLAPSFHAHVFRKKGVHRVILNLGGIANITVLPANLEEPIAGFDTGPGNGLLDDWIAKHQKTAFDRDGQWAASGIVNETLLSSFLSDPYFALSPPKSTGRDNFHLPWVEKHLQAMEHKLRPVDVQATLLMLTVESIALVIEKGTPHSAEIAICGGGAHNIYLMKQLKKRLPQFRINSTTKLGIDPDAIEALTFAWLARQTVNQRPGNNPAVTGAKSEHILGGIYQAYKSKP